LRAIDRTVINERAQHDRSQGHVARWKRREKMAAKKIWLTWMPRGDDAPQPDSTLQALKRYGLEVAGALWVDDLEKMAWSELGTTLLDPATADLWLVAGEKADLEAPHNRYALSLLAALLREGRPDLPIAFLGLDFAPTAPDMPTFTRSSPFLTAQETAWPSKVVAAAFGKTTTEPAEFRFNVIAHPLIGQWFEVGPVQGEWSGVMFGVSDDAKILIHAVGRRHELPEKTVLEYPVEGIKAQVRDVEYTAYSVQNRLGPEDSYFIKVEGSPAKLIFAGHPGEDQGEVVVLCLA
jgi:hypothetical protein